MKILVAPNAFKGSLSARDAASAIEQGIRNRVPNAEVVKILVSDGGDGFIDAIQFGLSTNIHQVEVTGPLGNSIVAEFLFAPNEKIAVIEMATASGLALLKGQSLDVLSATSYGTGQLIKSALDLDAKHIIIGIGGSATSDGGTGMANALGIVFRDAKGEALEGNAKTLSKISSIDLNKMDPRLRDVTIDVACDVNNKLLGPEGAAAIYSPQKGASKDQVFQIEQGLKNLAEVIENDLSINVNTLPGGGAAGGMGATLYAIFNAKIKPGAELLLDILEFDKKVLNADLVITTEGKLDNQTQFGKAPYIVASRANKYNVPTFAIAGQVETQNWQEIGFHKTYSLTSDKINVTFAINHAEELLTQTTAKAIEEFRSDGNINTEHVIHSKPRIVVYTDLDGTLLDHNNYRFSDAMPALTQLDSLKIPVIPVSSKTLPEIFKINNEIGLTHPVISENGGVIAFPKNYFKKFNGFELINQYWVKQTSVSYEDIIKTINKIRNVFNFEFSGFSDMSVEDVVTHTNLPHEDAINAKKRLASEPLLWLDSLEKFKQFESILNEQKLIILKGGRFWHVMGKTSKGDAIKQINQLFIDNEIPALNTIGLGDSPNDISMLNEVDNPVIVKRYDGTCMTLQNSTKCYYTNSIGPKGWNEYFQAYLSKH